MRGFFKISKSVKKTGNPAQEERNSLSQSPAVFGTNQLFLEFPGDDFMAAKAVLDFQFQTFSSCLSHS